jgi:nitrous oxidase accessory protein
MEKHLIKKGLVFAVILLFTCTSITPSYAVDNVNKPSTSIFNGNILYVGGSGPDNYTRIQDAIDNASSGDTVFVFNGTYFENVIINKSINLFGEDKNNTIIDGKRIDDTLWIMASFIYVSSFTILNSSTEDWNVGILVIEKEWWQPDDPPFLTNINISNCVIKNNRGGIRLYSNHDVNVSNCIIQNNPSTSIYVVSSNHITINNCIIIGNGEIYEGGIAIREDSAIGNCSNNITISNCSISYNFCDGISVTCGSQNIEINHNNIF